MDIFSGNRRLEEFLFYSLEWNLFLRNGQDSPLTPFLFLKNGEEMYIRMLMTDGDPVEYAKSVLAEEKEPFQQVVIGVEGYIRDEKNNRVDALIVQGFDVTQDKGVIIAQGFVPREVGEFRRIDKPRFMGNPDLPIPRRTDISSDFSVQEPGFTAIAVDHDGLTDYRVVISHPNPTVVVDTFKRFLRAKFGSEDALKLSGEVKLDITPQERFNVDMLQFLLNLLLKEELQSDVFRKWAHSSGRSFRIQANYDNKELSNSSSIVVNPHEHIEKKPTRYAGLTEEGLNEEFNRILAIPNPTQSMEALSSMTELINEFTNRGLPIPEARPREEKWYDKTWLVVILCLLIAPVGIFAAWKSRTLSIGLKWLLTLVFGGWFVYRVARALNLFAY